MTKDFGIVALISTAVISLNAAAGTTRCSNAEQTIKYSYDAPDGGAPRKSLIELAVDSNIVYKTTLNGANEVNNADYYFDAVTQKEIASSTNNDLKEKTSVYSVNLVVKLRNGEKNYSDFVICKDVRSTLKRP